jgi:hypothetical protein
MGAAHRILMSNVLQRITSVLDVLGELRPHKGFVL